VALEFIITVLAASLLGSTHCAGMCGPFTVMVAGNVKAGPKNPLHQVLGAYHLGRLTTYLLLGALAGGLGASLNATGELIGWQRIAAYLAGIAMLATAVVVLLRQLGLRIGHLPIPNSWVKVIHAGFRLVARWPALPRAFSIGLLTTWLPCGWLYAFVLVAAGTGSVIPALVVMLGFWVGTIPLLTLLGWSSAGLAPRMGKALPWVSIAACVILGFFTLFSRTTPAMQTLEDQLAGNMSVNQRIDMARRAKLPCCDHD
jgi:sulfite exporter TauE/SafE